MSTLRQIRALGLVVARHFLRSAVIAGKAPRLGGWGQSSGLLLRALFVVFLANAFHGIGRRASELGAHRLDAIRWLVLGATLYVAGTAFAADSPQIPGGRYPLRSPMLQTLPITTPARVVFVLLQQALLLPMLGAIVLGAASHRGSAASVSAPAVVLSLAIYASAALGGVGVSSTLRMSVAAHRLSRVAWGGSFVAIAGVMLALYAPVLAPVVRLPSFALDPSIAVARAIEGTASWGSGLFASLAFAALACVLVGIGERVGYDRPDAAPPQKPTPAKGRIDLDAIERIVASRELGGRALAWIFALLLVGSAWSAWGAQKMLEEPDGSKKAVDWIGVALGAVVAQVGSSLAMTRAARAVFRDAQARPLLSPLPIAPSDLLRGKVRALRRAVMPLALVGLPWVFVGTASTRVAFGWRAVVTTIALFLLCEAAVSIAFLTNGLGAPGVRSAGAPLSLPSFLLFLPFLNAVVASSPFSAALSLLALGAIAVEASRAARRCITWIDDADDVHERETEVWRALVVLAAFYAVQTLAARLLAFFGGSPALVLASAYALSGAALVLMTSSSGVSLRDLPIRPSRSLWLPAGVGLGASTAVLALGYRWVLRALHVEIPGGPDLDETGRAALAGAVVAIAPLAEEIFFRGWLQSAFRRELPDGWRRWAFAVAAFAFAAAHPPLSFVPVLFLGLAAGGLYAKSGGLAPGVLAHATHNALVLILVHAV